jgi:hypothetical protein
MLTMKNRVEIFELGQISETFSTVNKKIIKIQKSYQIYTKDP